MKTIVSIQEISEFDIKPRAAVEEWRGLVRREIGDRWRDRSGWIQSRWPTCEAEEVKPAFETYGVAYVECRRCGSLYAPRRPSESELWSWYRESPPLEFWRSRILPASDAARLEKVMRPRADWILDGLAEYLPTAERVVDLSPHGRGLLDMLAEDNDRLTEIIAAGTTADFEGQSNDRVKVRPGLSSALPDHGPADVVVAIDSFNRAADPGALLGAIDRTLVPGGLLFATASVASGFEVQSLWDRSPTIVPPDKLNLPSVQALQDLFTAPKWEIMELSTPGMFDVEMVRHALENEPDAEWPRVVRALVGGLDAAGRSSFVELLQTLRRTSFARFVIKKGE